MCKQIFVFFDAIAFIGALSNGLARRLMDGVMRALFNAVW